jgi:hypothetical protein
MAAMIVNSQHSSLFFSFDLVFGRKLHFIALLRKFSRPSDDPPRCAGQHKM